MATPIKTTQPTIYSIEPRAFLLADATNWQAATDPLTKDLLFVRKGTVVVDCWVDVTTATGGAGTCLLLHVTNVPADGPTIMSFNGNTAAITRGPITATGYDPATVDGTIALRKVGTGAAAVFSIYMSMLRPNMNP